MKKYEESNYSKHFQNIIISIIYIKHTNPTKIFLLYNSKPNNYPQI